MRHDVSTANAKANASDVAREAAEAQAVQLREELASAQAAWWAETEKWKEQLAATETSASEQKAEADRAIADRTAAAEDAKRQAALNLERHKLTTAEQQSEIKSRLSLVGPGLMPLHERLVVDMTVFSTQAERRLQEERGKHELEAA
eukprot:SAG31_NODE_16083_length_723_cov_1.560897_1_plen_146_part_10